MRSRNTRRGPLPSCELMRNIVLTGFMGTGKSTAGRILAKELGLEFLDLDAVIEREAGLDIKEIFSRFGEARFRDLERGLVKRLTDGEFGSNLVVSTGGGVVVDRANRDLLRDWGVVVCLKASVDEIMKRVGRNDGRPLLPDSELRETVEKLLDERDEAYRDSDLTIDTTTLKPVDVVKRIESFLDGTA